MRVSGWISGFGFLDEGFGFRVSGFWFRVSGFGFRVSGFGLRFSGLKLEIWVEGFGVSGLGWRVDRQLSMLPVVPRHHIRQAVGALVRTCVSRS